MTIISNPITDERDIDNALWAAYRNRDKNAVTMNLLRRYLREPHSFPSLSATQWSRSRARTYVRLAIKSPCELRTR